MTQIKTMRSQVELQEWLKTADIDEWNAVNLGMSIERKDFQISCPQEWWGDSCRGDWLGKLDVATGAYEKFQPVKRGDIVIDAGSHMGFFAKSVSDRAALVLAIEPHPRNAARISRLGLNNVRVVCAAVGDRVGRTNLFVHGTSVSHSTVHGEQCLGSIEVPMISIDSLGAQKVDFIKIDVEGSEAAMLRGARETIKRLKPFIVMESSAEDLPMVLNELSELKYRVAAWVSMLLHPLRYDTPLGMCLLHCVPIS